VVLGLLHSYIVGCFSSLYNTNVHGSCVNSRRYHIEIACSVLSLPLEVVINFHITVCKKANKGEQLDYRLSQCITWQPSVYLATNSDQQRYKNAGILLLMLARSVKGGNVRPLTTATDKCNIICPQMRKPQAHNAQSRMRNNVDIFPACYFCKCVLHGHTGLDALSRLISLCPRQRCVARV